MNEEQTEETNDTAGTAPGAKPTSKELLANARRCWKRLNRTEAGATLDRVSLVSGSSRVLSSPGSAAPANFAVQSAVVPGQSLLVAAHPDGMAAIDLTRLDNNPATSPIVRSISAAALGVIPVHVAATGTTAYVVGSSPSPQLVKVQLDTFRVLGRTALSGTPRGLAVSATQLVVATGAAVEVLSP